MSEQPHQLDYQVTRRPRRRWWLLALGLCALVVLGLGWKSRALIDLTWRRFQEMRQDRRAMAYEPPTGQVVWDDTPGAQPPITPAPAPLTMARALVFQHGRRTTGGNEVLVKIDLIAPRNGLGEHLAVTLYEPGTLTKWRRHFGPDLAWEAPPIVGGGRWKIFAGRADPNDPSHFTIEYVTKGQNRILEGWLVDIPRAPSGATTGLKMADRVK